MNAIEMITERGIDAKLARAVIQQLGGTDSLNDVANHGADAGYCGFTYYKDTVAFFKRHRKTIVALVEQQADDLGESPLDMVASFNCLGGQMRVGADVAGVKAADRHKVLGKWYPSVSRCLYGGRLSGDNDDLVANALAWFALEEVARAYSDSQYEAKEAQ